MIIYILKLCFLQTRQPYPNIYILIFHQVASCRSGSALRSIMHLIFRFLSLHTQGKHTFGILASLPPRFLHTVAYGMCSVPPHIPYPSASLRERSYASVALQPLPAASTFPCLPIDDRPSFNYKKNNRILTVNGYLFVWSMSTGRRTFINHHHALSLPPQF